MQSKRFRKLWELNPFYTVFCGRGVCVKSYTLHYWYDNLVVWESIKVPGGADYQILPNPAFTTEPSNFRVNPEFGELYVYCVHHGKTNTWQSGQIRQLSVVVFMIDGYRRKINLWWFFGNLLKCQVAHIIRFDLSAFYNLVVWESIKVPGSADSSSSANRAFLQTKRSR